MTDREKLIELLVEARSKAFTLCNDHAVCKGCEYEKIIGCHRACIVDHLIANGVTVQEWISVKDRLPKNAGEHILVCYDDGWVCDQYSPVDGGVTHWMLLPQTPKGE